MIGPRNSANDEVTVHHPGPQTPYSHIVVALDGSELAERVLAYVEPLAKAFGSTVTCVCVVEPINPGVIADVAIPSVYGSAETLLRAQEDVDKEGAAYLSRIRTRLAHDGLAVRCEKPGGRAAEAIVTIAREQGADLIAMTTHGRSGLGRALLGSVADEVVRTAPCPVLLVRLDRT